ncbi:lysophospholipase [Vitreoscilla massiliensis]|uniref:Lysophospholipase n=1 Tax=Vitreoscilla massiliensis TaxID=1689272 RepID=A0ABY4E562_9NEIS|nr:alpha/beta hydrolase [Vitreoscilla massiliensis]UOO90901.1 lysophospholipase [Vitreoscilla massiliensis]
MNKHIHTAYPATVAPTFNLVIVHGMQEHAGRYHEFATFLSEHGGNVITFDLPGHGAFGHNAEQLGNFGEEGLPHVFAQIAAYFDYWDNGLPNVLFGHSMGSAIALRYAQLHHNVHHLILSGVPYRSARFFNLAYHTAVIEKRVKGANKESMLCRQTAKFNDFFAPNRTPYDWLSLNTDNVDRYIADPHCGYPISISYFEEMLNLMRMAFEPQELLKMGTTLPILLLWGEQDPCTNFGKSSYRLTNFLRQHWQAEVNTIQYPKLRHEILHEHQRGEVFQDVLASIAAVIHAPTEQP